VVKKRKIVKNGQVKQLVCIFDVKFKHMHLRRLSIILILTLIGFHIHAQLAEFGSNVMQDEKLKDSTQTIFQPKVNVSIGASFSAFSGGSAFNTWVMPQITMPLAQRWNISFGMGYSNTNYNGLNQWSGGQNNAQYGMLYVSGQYLMNEKITLTGTAYKKWLLNPASNGDVMNNGYMDFSTQGVILDVNYKVTDHFQINVGMEYRQQSNPMMQGFQQGMSTGFDNGMPGGYYPFP
jgi:hypothetical protein